MKEKNTLLNNTVVTTVMSNFGLYKAFDSIGIEYAKTPVGDRYVYDYMAKNNNRLGGEESGHIIFSKYATTGDGILTSLMIMEIMLSKELPLSKLYDGFTLYPQILVNVKVKDKSKIINDIKIKEIIDESANELGNLGRILVRESGTEPVIRVMAEAFSYDICKKYTDIIVNAIKSAEKN